MFCRNCNTHIEDSEEIECPNCEAVLKTAPARRERNRPVAETVAVVESANYNGEYRVQKLSDGSCFCDCLSFLSQNGTRVVEPTISQLPFMTCKHIRRELQNRNGSNGNGGSFVPPSPYQKACLKKLGVKVEEHLTNAQAYYILKTHLERQGLRYDEFKSLILEHPKVNFLPLNYFGVEFEGGLGCDKNTFEQTLTEAGISSVITDYDHTLHNKKWKLGSDRSVSVPNLTNVEIVSPKLYGALGFQELTKVLKLWNETLPFRNNSTERIPGVNSSCGTHVHVDASYGWEMSDLYRLAKVWAKIEQPVIWYLVSPSRRDRSYCKAVDFRYMEVLSEGGRHGDRYASLNLEAYYRQKSVEFRIHNGTLDSRKIIPWVVFCLMLTDAVRRGLSHNDFEPTFDGIMDAVGMTSNTTPLIKEARSFLGGRFQHWKEDAERNPSSVPSVETIDLESLERELQRRRDQRRRDRAETDYRYRRRLTTADESLPHNSIHNLASLIPSSVIRQELFNFEGEGRWSVPSRSGEGGRYIVTHNARLDTLSCTCRAFRTHDRCYHSINTARYIYTQRVRENIESNGGGNV